MVRPVRPMGLIRSAEWQQAVLVCTLGTCLLLEPCSAVDLRARTTTASKQFTIYCEDVALRSRVAGFVEDVKSGVYSVLGKAPWGKIPIVVTLEVGESP